jgi:hypothetical protein
LFHSHVMNRGGLTIFFLGDGLSPGYGEKGRETKSNRFGSDQKLA